MQGKFHYFDYIIFFGYLCITGVIGVYFGYSGNRTSKEYLYGNRKMSALPVGLSLFSSAISSIAILGIPTEVYTFGFQFVVGTVSALLSLFITWNLVLPVFCGSLEIQTPYEYFERRFNSTVRLLSSFIYILHTLLYMPIAFLVISLAISQSTGISLVVSNTIIGGVCVFYTMFGGFKTVIWTDSFQAILMLFSTFFILTLGVLKIGSVSEVLRRAQIGHRAQFDMDPNPFKRLTSWSALIGSIFYFSSQTGCAASSLQRYMSLRNQKDAKFCSFVGMFGVGLMIFLTSSIGLTMFALYYDCDPVLNQQIQNPNQLTTLYIADVIGNIPGYSGLFYAGILSAGLSTVSSELNTVSGLVYYDFLQKYIKRCRWIREAQSAFILKVIVLINGVFYLVITPIIQNSPLITQLAVLIAGVTYGIKLGIMLLGTTFPKANSIGTISGALVSLIIMGWIGIGSQIFNTNTSTQYVLPLSTTNCTNQTIVLDVSKGNSTYYNEDEPFILYKLALFYYPLLGSLLTIIISLVISYFTGFTNIHSIDSRLLIPCMRPIQQIQQK